ncbi:hypothetical protein ES708_15401 [subsurface metagenome]
MIVKTSNVSQGVYFLSAYDKAAFNQGGKIILLDLVFPDHQTIKARFSLSIVQGSSRKQY